MSPPRKDPIKNKNKNSLLIEKDQSIPPHLPNCPPGFKYSRNEAADDHQESTDTLRTDKDDWSRTDKDEYIENIKAMKNKNSVEE